MPRLTKDSTHPLTTYDDVLMMLVCPDATPNCYLERCNDCPGSDIVRKTLVDILQENGVTNVTYKQWISKPQTTLESRDNQSAEEFALAFQKLAGTLLKHAFIAKQQSRFYKNLKANLTDGECAVQVDLAENFAFIVQDAAPGFHWNNNQATIYTVVIYFNNESGIEHKSLVIISNCMHHDAIAVFMFSRIINDVIKNIVARPKKISYVSDGAPQQYKNYKNFSNIYNHQQDFGIPAEWHFFATAHGKGPCDGVGGTVKRLAARASLQRSSQDQITTPLELYRWATESGSISSIIVRYAHADDYEKEKEFLAPRFASARFIKNTQKLHSFIPEKEGKVKTKIYSNAEEYEVHKICK